MWSNSDCRASRASVYRISGELNSLHGTQWEDWEHTSAWRAAQRWFHQHFNVGARPARYLALKPLNSRKFPGLRKLGSSESVKAGDDQIEYEDEDPRIRKMFEGELAKRGVVSRMQEILSC